MHRRNEKGFSNHANRGINISTKRETLPSMTSRLNPSDSSLSFDLVVPGMIAANTKQMMRLIAQDMCKSIGISERILAERLMEREKMSPSAMGDGIAIIQLPLSGLKNPVNAFIRLKNPVSMGAVDNKAVDIVCVLLTPEREGSSYLRSLARLSRLLRNAQTCAKLRASSDEKTIRNILEQSSIQQMAA